MSKYKPYYERAGFKSEDELRAFSDYIRRKKREEREAANRKIETQYQLKRKKASTRTIASRVDYFESEDEDEDEADSEDERTPAEKRQKRLISNALEEWSDDEPQPLQDQLLQDFIESDSGTDDGSCGFELDDEDMSDQNDVSTTETYGIGDASSDEDMTSSEGGSDGEGEEDPMDIYDI